MTWKRLRRLLEPYASGAALPDPDPHDPRLGHLLAPLDKEASGGTTCVIVGAPQHIGIERNGGRQGAAEAPAAIRHWLYRMATADCQSAMESGMLRVVDAGDLRPNGLTLRQIHDEQHDVVHEILDNGMVPIVLGGGHDTAWPTIRALETDGVPYGVINIDAHADVRPLKDGSAAHSGSPFRQMLDAESSNLVKGAFVEFGLQHTTVSRDHRAYVTNAGHHVMMLDAIRGQGALPAWDQALLRVATAERLYVSLDMDAFASAFAPGVSAPSADGFAPWEIGPALRRSARDPRFSAFDVVEVSPPWDADGRTAKLAASMIMQVLAGIADRTSAA